MAGAHRPKDVHPDHDRPTPENIDEWSEEQLDRFNDLKEAEHEQQVQENRAELSQEQQKTLEALESATLPEDEELTETVQIDQAEVVVRKRVTGEIEQTFTYIQKNRDDLESIANALIDAISELIVDDNEDGEYRFTERTVWEEYHRRHGTESLIDVFDIVADPALSRQEELEKFRSDRSGS